MKSPLLEPAARIEQLDSLRGLAALSVVSYHHLIVFPGIWNAVVEGPATWAESLLFAPPLYLLLAGPSAVILFFVLSGYVLSLPFLSGRRSTYRQYALKRWCRIYPPYLVAVVGAMLGSAWLSRGEIAELSTWFQSQWVEWVDARHLLSHLLLLPNFAPLQFNGVIWSLIYEMWISLFFPLLMVGVVRYGWQWNLLGALALSVGGCLLPQFLGASTGLCDAGRTAHYAGIFIIGALLAKHRGALATKVESLRPAARLALVCLGIGLVTADGLTVMARVGPWVRPFEYLTAAGAAILVVCAASSRALLAAPLVALGRISYSWYLWHLPVMLAAVHWGYGRLPLGAILSLSIGAGLAVAALMYRWIEAPSARLAKSIGRPTVASLPAVAATMAPV